MTRTQKLFLHVVLQWQEGLRGRHKSIEVIVGKMCLGASQANWLKQHKDRVFHTPKKQRVFSLSTISCSRGSWKILHDELYLEGPLQWNILAKSHNCPLDSSMIIFNFFCRRIFQQVPVMEGIHTVTSSQNYIHLSSMVNMMEASKLLKDTQ